ncbi:MAG TPA: TonB-dependent receptor [Prolixibacteraceae bacterium]|nr:TonB-dependent receptor [Prolixibacteraceae bacterium]
MKKNRLFLWAIVMLPLLFFSIWSYGQTSSIRGLVTDESGEPLLGVNVVVQGTIRGTVTDIDGKFEIQASPDETLNFSFIGYISKSIKVQSQSEINVQMSPTYLDMGEVVVVGYGTVKKSDLTGAVTSVKSDELMANAPTSVQSALQGKAAGVLITSGNTVNSTPNIRIRGNRSIGANNDPLFVVDGFPMNGGLESINPNDIASIEILKDASATAIYGSRGANGVILVTTKKGEAGKITVEYDGYLSIGTLDRYRKVMNAGEYADFVREGNRKYIYDGEGGYTLDPKSSYSSLVPDYNQDMSMVYFTQDPYLKESIQRGWADGTWNPDNVRSFDWQMAGYRDFSSSQTHNISIRGGSDNTMVFFSGSFLDQKDIQLQSFRKRYTLHLNVDQKFGDRISMGGNVDFSYLNWNDGKGIPTFWNPLGTPWNSPNGDVTLEGDPAYGLIEHPCGEPLQYNSFYDIDGVVKDNQSNNIMANLYFELKLLKGLSYRANFGTSLYLKQAQEFYSHFSTVTGLGNPRAKQSIDINRGWNFDNILAYNTTIGDHAVGATFVQSNEKFISEPVSIEGNDIPFENQMWYSLESAETRSLTSAYTQWSMMSWLGRVNYSLKDRYLFTASVRYDGSSRLAEGHKWVAFPSLALGWRITEEEFMKDNRVVSNLKLRLGFGVTGNSAVAPYSTEGQIKASRYNWGKTEGVLGYEPSTLSNKALSWEKTEQYNAGVDFGFYKGRLSGTIDLYQQHTYNLLMARSLPAVSGFTSIMQNIGETQNKGIEISLNTVNIKKKNIMWTTDFTFAVNDEKITMLASGLSEDLANFWFVGYPIDTYYDYVADEYVWGYSKDDMEDIRLFKENKSSFKPGDLKIIDQNNDYRINPEDRMIRGSKMPKWSVSMANTLTVGAFDLYLFMYGAFGQTVYWDPGQSIGGRSNTAKVDYWTPERTQTKWLAPHADIQMPSNISAMYYWKGDFLKISDVTLGYTLPNYLTHKMNIEKIRMYGKIQNPYMFTNFEGNDPEAAIAHQRDAQGKLTSFWDAPFTMRSFMLGLNVTF